MLLWIPLLLVALYAGASPVKLGDLELRQDAPAASGTAVAADVTAAATIDITDAMSGPTSALSPTASPEPPTATTSTDDTSVPNATAAASPTSSTGGVEGGPRAAASTGSSDPSKLDLTVVKVRREFHSQRLMSVCSVGRIARSVVLRRGPRKVLSPELHRSGI